MATVAVLGGGISGLTCAYYLKTLGRSKLKYLFLIEKSPKFGGWIQTTRYPDGAVFEHGPRTLRVPTKSGCNALLLAEDLDLHSRILPITKNHPTAKTNFILADNKLHPLPREFSAVFRKAPPLSKPLFSYAFKELRTKSAALDDESIHSFVERRIGKDVADYLFDPLCRGITAGDVRELSVRSMFPLLYEAEQKYGSIIKGLFKNAQNSPMLQFANSSKLIKQAYEERWRMWTLKSGLTELIDALACSVEEREFSDLIFNAECTHMKFKGDKVELAVENEVIEVDHVFSCIPSNHLAKLIPECSKLASLLNSISYVDMAVIYLEYADNVLKYPGFGFLTPSFEDSKILGVVFDSNCFPSLNGNSKTRLTCMIGGKWFKDVLGNPKNVNEEQILNVALDGVKKHLGIEVSPVRFKVTLQEKCIAQYVLGHYKTLEALENEISEKKLNLSLVGASYKGAGVPDCIYNSKVAVQEYFKML